MHFFFTVHDAAGHTRRVQAHKDQSCTEALYLAGLLPSRPLCAGMGRCGQCSMRFDPPPSPLDADGKRLSPDDLERGIRLACLHPAPREGNVIMDTAFPAVRETSSPVANLSRRTTGAYTTLAVDLGTTTLEWSVERCDEPNSSSSPDTIAMGRELNPQFGAGSEVMSRLAFARREGGAVLRTAVLKSLQAAVKSTPVDAMCVAGNPAMIHLLLGLNVDGLATAPYQLDFRGDTVEELPRLPPCYIPPLLSPFVGADLSAGMVSLLDGTDKDHPNFPFLLADMGTNGEFILAMTPDDFTACSIPLGPALEGVGFPHGAMAGPGTITGFDLTPAGIAPRMYDASGPGTSGVAGITGTGYLSLLAGLRAASCLNEQGQFSPEAGPLAARLLSGLDKRHGEAYLALPLGTALYAADVEEMLKVKAAFNQAVSSLLHMAGLRAADLAAVFLAGNMGQYVRTDDLVRLGFLPQVLSHKIHAVGNTSLDGARLLAADIKARRYVRTMARHCRTLDLTNAPNFGEHYLQRMRFTYV